MEDFLRNAHFALPHQQLFFVFLACVLAPRTVCVCVCVCVFISGVLACSVNCVCVCVCVRARVCVV